MILFYARYAAYWLSRNLASKIWWTRELLARNWYQFFYFFSSFRVQIRTWVSRSLWKFLSDDRAKGQIWAHFEALFHIPQLMLLSVQEFQDIGYIVVMMCVSFRLEQSLVLSCGKWSVSRNFRGWKLITCWAVRKNNNRPRTSKVFKFFHFHFFQRSRKPKIAFREDQKHKKSKKWHQEVNIS